MVSPKITKDFAEQEFNRFCESMMIETNYLYMDEDDQSGFNNQKARLVSSIMSGALAINDDGEAVYTPVCKYKDGKYKDSLTFHEPTVADLQEMDKTKSTEGIKKTVKAVSQMCRKHPGYFSDMKSKDYNVCVAIFSLFMA